MFDAGSTSMGIEVVESRVEYDRAWLALHARIKEAGREECVVKARIVELLLEADETKLFRRMGYATMFAYVEGELGYSHHTATEHMRVAHDLVTLPETAAVFGAGELSWTSARELTRVITPKTETVWLDAIEGKKTTDVVEMLRGKGKGDLPHTPVDPKKLRHRVVLDLSSEAFATYKATRNAIAEEIGDACSDDAYVLGHSTTCNESATDKPTRPPFQLAVTTCRSCKTAAIVAAGVVAPITPARLAMVECDHEHIGDLELDENERLTSEIPASKRRKVWIRDGGRCVIPGCRSTRHLSVHHIVFRERGGKHELWNLALICDAHHMQLHDGIIGISGRAPDLVFELPSVDDAFS